MKNYHKAPSLTLRVLALKGAQTLLRHGKGQAEDVRLF